MLELTRIEFDLIKSKLMKVNCESNDEMGQIKLNTLLDLARIDKNLETPNSLPNPVKHRNEPTTGFKPHYASCKSNKLTIECQNYP